MGAVDVQLSMDQSYIQTLTQTSITDRKGTDQWE